MTQSSDTISAVPPPDGLQDQSGSVAGSVLAGYSFLGLGTAVQTAFGNGVDQSYIQQSGDSSAITSGDQYGGDEYTGLDRFGDVIDQNYFNTTTPTPTTTDRFQYSYDQDGNVLYSDNLVDPSNSQLYHASSTASGDDATAYDPLDRLTGFEEGTLSASGNNGTTLDTVSSPTLTKSYALDAVGNQTSVTTNGTPVDNTVDSQNQLTAVGSSDLGYDYDGNTTTSQSGDTYTYDAWNHIITDTSPTTNYVTTYSYNALGERVTTNQTAAAGAGPVAVVNNGSPQRSMVDSLTVIFPSAVTLSSGAITLYNTTGSYDESISYTNPSGDGKTWLVSFTGSDIAGGSLPNGVYDLTVNHADVSGITLSSNITWAFHRLFGDINGDGTVNSADEAVFDEDFSSERYGPTYDPAFDDNLQHRDFNTEYSAFLSDYGDSETYTPTGAPFLTVPITGSSVLQDISPWANVTNALYYSNQGQVLETRANGTVTSQSVWGLDYINDLVAYDTNATSGSLGVSGSGLGQRLYVQHDANYDVTALTDTSGTVVERYEYDPYGTVTVLNPDGTVRGDGTMASSHFGVPNLLQGMRYDSVTGLYASETRDLNLATGTWMQADPAGYVDGSDLYQPFDSSPAGLRDPSGLSPDGNAADPGGASDFDVPQAIGGGIGAIIGGGVGFIIGGALFPAGGEIPGELGGEDIGSMVFGAVGTFFGSYAATGPAPAKPAGAPDAGATEPAVSAGPAGNGIGTGGANHGSGGNGGNGGTTVVVVIGNHNTTDTHPSQNGGAGASATGGAGTGVGGAGTGCPTSRPAPPPVAPPPGVVVKGPYGNPEIRIIPPHSHTGPYVPTGGDGAVVAIVYDQSDNATGTVTIDKYGRSEYFPTPGAAPWPPPTTQPTSK